MADEQIQVEVVYALPDQQALCSLRLPLGACLLDAVQQSGLVERFDLQLDLARLGIFGRICSARTLLKPGDRVSMRFLHGQARSVIEQAFEEEETDGIQGL